MANNDKLKEIISNLQNLIDLAVGMKDSEFYPVSFFSNTFDLLQKIRNGFHTLEAEQVEMFALQMKRHQELIISIHQQMRNIERISESKTSFEMPKPTTAPETENTEKERPKKTSIFNRIIGTENVQALTTPPEAVKPAVIPTQKVTETKPKDISTPQEK
ncbi:MAG: hypothetical protein LBS16_04660, partial [Prevotellaceae bacterium]|nr:hypothetical protein [Prevotellaceae bacterium]